MGTFSKATNKTSKPFEGAKRDIFVLRNTINFASATQFPTKPVQNDIVEAVAIPANTMILRAWVDVDVAETGAADVDVGWGGAADNLLDGINITAIGVKHAIGTNGGKIPIFTVADTIDLVLNSAVTHDEGKVTVYVACLDVTPDA